MAKLIFSDRLDGFKQQFPNWESNSDASYRSVAFCEDGYIVTHGKVFRTPLGTNENIYGLAVSNTNGQLKVSAGGYTAPGVNVIIDAADSDYLTKSITNGVLTYSHKKPGAQGANRTSTTAGSTTTTEVDTSASIVGGLTSDDYGHVVEKYSRTLVLNKVKSATAVADTVYYLLGHSSSTTDFTDFTYKNSNIYFQNGDLHVQQLYVNGSSITDLISASQALYFRGTLDSTYEADNASLKRFKALPTSGVTVGDLYVVGAGGYTLGEGASAEVCEAGDMVIATNSNPITWAAVQRNLVAAITEANLTGSTVGNKLRVFKDANDNNLYVTQTDTDTWRNITVNSNAFLGTGVDTGALNFKAGSGIELIVTTAGTIEIKNTSLLSSAKTLTLSYKATANTENASDIFTYNPSSANQSLEFDAGDNVTLSYDNNILTIESSYVDTLYKLIVSNNINAAGNYTAAADADGVADPYLILRSTGTDSTYVRFVASGAAQVTAKNGVIDIFALNTWRNVTAYKYNSTNQSQTSGEILSSSISTADLDFGEDFLWDATTSDNTSGQLHIGWAEVTSTVDGQGNVTSTTIKYHI